MITDLAYVTTNARKVLQAKGIFAKTGISIHQVNLDTPEIQSEDADQISAYSAEYLKSKVPTPYFVMDRSFHISALKGFPGPFVKFIGEWLSPAQVLSLIPDGSDRSAYWVTSLSCRLESGEIRTFSGRTEGSIASKVLGDNGYLIDRIFIPEGQVKSLAELTDEERFKIFSRCPCWAELISCLKSG